MRDQDGFLLRFVARVRALAPEDWRGRPGGFFRRSMDAVFKYNAKHVHIERRIDQAPDLAWKAVEGAALQKHASAALQYAQEENQQIQTALQKRILEARVRQENATADKLEAEARFAQFNEFEKRLSLASTLRKLGVTFVSDGEGSLTAIAAPPGYDWTVLTTKLMDLWRPSKVGAGTSEDAAPVNPRPKGVSPLDRES